jgi:hypothetical protein
MFNPLNAELNPIYHLLALLGGATIVVFSRLRVKIQNKSVKAHISISCPSLRLTISIFEKNRLSRTKIATPS